ncbi:unnamed protein product [Schistosoma intercalatum]|nr:unnamed protein product [Schistosoma intercalatum]
MISHTNNYTDQQYNYFPKPFILNKTNTNINNSDNITNESNDNDNHKLIHLNKHSSSFKSILNTETTSKLDQSFRTVRKYLITESNPICYYSMDTPNKNDKLILKKELPNVKQKIDQFNKIAYNHMFKSRSNIPIIKLNNNEFPWTNEQFYLRQVNKTLNLWNSNEQVNSKSVAMPNITNFSNINNQHNHEGFIDSNYDVLSVKSIFKNVNQESIELKNTLSTDKQYKYHKTKREHSFLISNHPNESDKYSSQTEQNQLLIGGRLENKKKDNDSNNNLTVDGFINNNIIQNVNLLSEQFTLYVYRNSNQNLGFSVSRLNSLFNETSNYYVVISGIQLPNKNSHLRIGDCILSVNEINLINMDLMKSVRLLKSTPFPIQLKIQRLNKINLLTDINYEEDFLSVDTDTDEEAEIMTKIIDMAQNFTSTKCKKINEQLDLEDNQNINLCNVELTETNHNTINDNRITKTVIQSQFVKLLRQKVIKWLHLHQTLIQLNKYKLKQFNKDHYNYGDETEVTMNNTDEMIWKDDRVLGELKYFLFNRFHYI